MTLYSAWSMLCLTSRLTLKVHTCYVFILFRHFLQFCGEVDAVYVLCVDIFASNVVPEELSSMNINDLMQYAYMEVKLIIEWARKVPGRCAGTGRGDKCIVWSPMLKWELVYNSIYDVQLYSLHWFIWLVGFSDLIIEDQMALLKSSFMELMVLRLTFR